VKRLLPFMVTLAACSPATQVSGTACMTDADCNLFNVKGTCETTGFCSYPDSTCGGGKRYSPGAGSGLANTCIGGDPACGAKDQPCCGAGACGPYLTCSSEGGTCQCGGIGQPCCGGTTCSAGACAADQTCKMPVGFTQVAVGATHICALATDKTVWCWGEDWTWDTHVPGHRLTTMGGNTPRQVAGATDIVELHSGEFHACGRKSDNTLWCWGHNESGQLGNGTTNTTTTATQIPSLGAVQRFDTGKLHTCAVGSYNGAPGVWCFGHAGVGTYKGAGNPNLSRLGNNNTADSSVPVPVDLSAAAAAGQTVRAISTGGFHSCIVMSDNTVWCWGRGGNGELGNAATADTKVPVEVNLTGIAIPNGVTIDSVSCSDSKKGGSTCISTSNNNIYCWGSGGSGELGDSTNNSRSQPTARVVADFVVGKIAQVASGQQMRCLRSDAGAVWCWGGNTRGVFGTGQSSMQQNVPIQSAMAGATQLDVGHHTACAIDGMNQLFCWGNNVRGQITLRTPTALETSILGPRQIVVTP
jgi:alpha-tubulin suppressor-like RCC1 family protein